MRQRQSSVFPIGDFEFQYMSVETRLLEFVMRSVKVQSFMSTQILAFPPTAPFGWVSSGKLTFVARVWNAQPHGFAFGVQRRVPSS